MRGDENNPKKEGLQSALDFTKFALAIAGAAIAFLLNSDTLTHVRSDIGRLTITISLLSFGTSAIGGILVLMQGATNLSNADYRLGSLPIRIPGLANFVGLVLGFAFATAFVIGIVWAPAKTETNAIPIKQHLDSHASRSP